MKLQTDFSNTLQDPLFKILKETVDEVGIESYVIGGFVRDLILGRVQKKDIDIVALGSGIDLAKAVQKN